jgi:hypothetical protein
MAAYYLAREIKVIREYKVYKVFKVHKEYRVQRDKRALMVLWAQQGPRAIKGFRVDKV